MRLHTFLRDRGRDRRSFWTNKCSSATSESIANDMCALSLCSVSLCLLTYSQRAYLRVPNKNDLLIRASVHLASKHSLEIRSTLRRTLSIIRDCRRIVHRGARHALRTLALDLVNQVTDDTCSNPLSRSATTNYVHWRTGSGRGRNSRCVLPQKWLRAHLFLMVLPL